MDGLSINAKAVRVQAMGVNSSLLVFPILFHSVPPSERTFFPFSLFDSRTETEEEGFAPSFLFRSFRLSSFIECLLLQLARLRSALCFLSGVSKSGWVHSNMQCLPTFISDALLRGPSLLEYQGFSPMYLMGMIYVKAHIWSLLDKQQNQKKRNPCVKMAFFEGHFFPSPRIFSSSICGSHIFSVVPLLLLLPVGLSFWKLSPMARDISKAEEGAVHTAFSPFKV